MQYLLDIADLVLPHLRTCRERQAEHVEVLRVTDRECATTFGLLLQRWREQGERDRRPASQESARGGPGRAARSKADADRLEGEWAVLWGQASDADARVILADVLARHSHKIPQLLKAIGQARYYPRYLDDLLATTIEAAQPAKRVARGRLGAWLHAHFTGFEHAALLRDRQPIVAEVLAGTCSGRALIRNGERRESSSSARRSAGVATANLFGASGLGVARSLRERAAARRRAMAREAGTAPTDDWCVIVEQLESSGESITASLASQAPTPRQQFVRALRDELLVNLSLVGRLAEVTGAATPFGVVFAAELDEVQKSRQCRLDEPSEPIARYPPMRASEMKLFGLALSGGGIRSATFNLGILQGLAQLRILHEVDYLSTVSGGGYIGAWLTAWIKRATITHANGRRETGVCAIEEVLRAEPLPDPDGRAVRPIRFLREYSNYLTPQAGFFSADTWAMVAIWLRNTLLNQMVLGFALASVLLAPWLIWLVLSTIAVARDSTGLWRGCRPAMALSALLLWTCAYASGRQLRRFNLPPAERHRQCGAMLGQIGVLLKIVAPAVFACVLLATMVFEARGRLVEPAFRAQAFIDLFVLFFVCHVLVAVTGQYWQCFLADRVSGASRPWRTFRQCVWAGFILIVAGVAAAATGAGLAVIAGLVLARAPATALPLSQHWVVIGVPTLTATLSLMIVLKLGIIGRNLFDEHREWWSRVGAWLTIVTLAWLALFSVALYSPFLVALAATQWSRWVLASGSACWALWTAAGVLLGRSDKHAPGLRAALASASARRWIVLLAPYVFIVGLLVLVSTAAHALVAWGLPPDVGAGLFGRAHWSGWGRVSDWLLLATPMLAALAFLLSCRVDINEFSMHHFYKNRLVRCYLGASRDSGGVAMRSPDPFTGFDRADEVQFADLRPKPGGSDPELRRELRRHRRHARYVGPLPIVNVALNLVQGDDLAWQERKAQSFAFTPLYSGYDYRHVPPRDDRRRHFRTPGDTSGPAERRHADALADEGFRATPLYGYPPFGIGLGTATAISGAAASPNMGYHSSPPSAFLMTVFNARLGWWMGNPRDKYNWLRSGPRRGLLYLFNELFGLTHDRSSFVNLSDGGHFENLGLYELIRRRCRYIVASDAEQDTSLAFEGLGNAIRKCRIDFGVEIDIRATRIHPAEGAAHSPFHSVIGDIRYPDGEKGVLLYLKASLTGDEPSDVLEYKSRQPAFPHHSTLAGQFFDESQFESYRKLGVHVAQTTLGKAMAEGQLLEDCFDFLRDYWYPASSAVERHFGSHTSHFDELVERVRKDPQLQFLDPAFFTAPEGGPPPNRQEVFIGVTLLDLMQRVFIDLDLEHDDGHPHNVGWMAIFRKWKQQPSVQAAWEASRSNYGRRFQRFVERL